MFRTATVHPQELLCRYCNADYGTCRYVQLVELLYQLDVSDSASLTTYRSLHIQYLQRSSRGWTVTVRNM